MLRYDSAIAGPGHGGAACAMRQVRCSETMALVGVEPDPRNERPPLSKQYLPGDKYRTDVDRPAGELPAIARVGVIASGQVSRKVAAVGVTELTR